MSNGTLPPDVTAYLIHASQQIASEQGFTPGSLEEMADWLETNHRVIGERARDLQRQLLEKMQNRTIAGRVYRVLGAQVWADVRGDEIQRQANTVIAAALEPDRPMY